MSTFENGSFSEFPTRRHQQLLLCVFSRLVHHWYICEQFPMQPDSVLLCTFLFGLWCTLGTRLKWDILQIMTFDWNDIDCKGNIHLPLVISFSSSSKSGSKISMSNAMAWISMVLSLVKIFTFLSFSFKCNAAWMMIKSGLSWFGKSCEASVACL